MLSDFLRDGDFVILQLGDKLRVEAKSGAPKLSHWATVAFTSNSHEDHAEDEESQDDSGPDPHIRMEMTSKSEFMRLILCSQMPNQKRIDHCVVTEWPKVTKSMPKLTPQLSSAFQSIFKKYWSTLSELFQLFGQDGRMSHENFYQFVTEINLFSMKDTSTITKRIFGRICKAANVTNYIDIGLLMVALLLCAQVRHNDTFEFSSHVETATQALEEIFERNIMNYAENQGLPSVLKGHFSSDDVLYLIRDKHDKLFSVYEAYAVRSHELPTSLTAEDMSQLLQDAKLQYEGEGSLQRTRQLLSDVRKGLVIGREPPGSGESKDEVVIPDNEFTYPEYVEVSSSLDSSFFNSGSIVKYPLGLLRLGMSSSCVINSSQL